MNDAAAVLDHVCRRTLDHVGVLVRIWTPPDGVVYVNRRWLEFTGTSLQDNVGDGWLQCVHEDDRASVASHSAGDGRSEPATYRLKTRDGQLLAVTDSPARWTADDGARALGVIHTVTPGETSTAGDGRDKTMSKWAHELRGPLNAILGWSDLLSAGDSASDVVQRGLKAIANNARQQAQIIKRMTE